MKIKNIFIKAAIAVAAIALFAYFPAHADYNAAFYSTSNSFIPGYSGSGFPTYVNIPELDNTPRGPGLYIFCANPTNYSGTPDATGFAYYFAGVNGTSIGDVAMTNLGGGWYYLPPNLLTSSTITDVGFANAAISQNTSCGAVPGAGSNITLYDHLPGPQMSFLFPIDGTTTPAFDNFALTLTGLTSTDQYYIQITKIFPQVATNYAYSPTLSGAQMMYSGVRVPSEPFDVLGSTATSSALLAQAFLYDVTNWSPPQPLTAIVSTTVGYYQLPEPIAGVITGVATTTFLKIGIQGNASTSITATVTPGVTNGIPGVAPASATGTPWGLICAAPSSSFLGISNLGADLAFAGCQVVNFMFVPNQAVVQTVQGRFSDIAGDFPFNMVYGTLGQLASAATAVPNPNATSTYDLYLPIFGAQIPVLTSTSLSAFIGTTNTQTIFKVESNLAWFGSAWLIVKIIF